MRGSSWRASPRSLSGPLVVAVSVRGAGVEDQPPGGDLLPVLLPQPGAGGVQRGGLVGQLPGLVQVPRPVRLVGGHRRAVSLHAGAVALAGTLPGRASFALRGDVCARLVVCAWGGASGFRFGSAGLRAGAGCPRAGYSWLGRRGIGLDRCCAMRSSASSISRTRSRAAASSVGVREGLADAAAGVGDLAAGVVDVGQRLGLACF